MAPFSTMDVGQGFYQKHLHLIVAPFGLEIEHDRAFEALPNALKALVKV